MGGCGCSNNANAGGLNASNANLTGAFVGGTPGTHWQMKMVVFGFRRPDYAQGSEPALGADVQTSNLASTIALTAAVRS
jgi:hypothetical protein